MRSRRHIDPDSDARMQRSTPTTAMIDPLVRLRIEELQDLQHVHLYSEIDDDDDTRMPPAAAGTVNGVTEWATPERIGALSFSWDWTYDRSSQRLQGHWHSLRTNLRVVGPAGEDLGEECTRLCVARLMTRVCWEHVVADALGLALAMPPDARH